MVRLQSEEHMAKINNGNIKLLLDLFLDYIKEPDFITSEEKFISVHRSLIITRNEIISNEINNLNAVVMIIIDSNGNVKYTDNHRRTILHHFLMEYVNFYKRDINKERAFIENLIKLGASVLDLDYEMNTPLGIVLKKKRLDLVPILLTCIDATNTNEETVLHVLIDKYVRGNNNYLDFIKILQDLMSKNAIIPIINKKDHKGMAAVHYAAEHCYLEILKILKDNGADLTARTKIGDNPLIIVCKNIDKLELTLVVKTIHWLIKQGNDVNLQNEEGYTPLHYVSKCYALDAVMSLVKAGANVNATAKDNINPLYAAAMTSNFEVMKYLIKSGADISKCKAVRGLNLLHLTALRNGKKRLRLIIKKDSGKVNVCENEDVSPLHLASMMGNNEAVDELIAHGANVNCRTKSSGYTPLMLAAMRGEYNEFEVEFFDKNDLYKFDYFAKVNDKKIRDYDRCRMYYNLTNSSLLQAGADINAKDSRGRTPFHLITNIRYCYDGILPLLNAGAHVNVYDSFGVLPIHNVVKSENVIGFQYLLDFGADINDVITPDPQIFSNLINRQHRLATSLLCHAVKLKAIGLQVCKEYQLHLNTPKFQSCYKECLKEIEKLKIHIFKSDAVSVYDFLFMSFRQQSKVMDNFIVNIESKFPIYHRVIKGTHRRAVDRQLLMESAKLAIDLITKVDWPELCSDHILSYLSNSYLRVLVDSV